MNIRSHLEDKDFCEQEIALIISFLSKEIDKLRSMIFGCLYLNMINKRISYERFIDYCDLTNKMYISDFKYLVVNYEGIEENYAKLSGIGLYKYQPAFNVDTADGHLKYENIYPLTEFGAEYKGIINNIVDLEMRKY